MTQKLEEPSNTILMIVGELKSIAAQLTNAVEDIREHRTQYREDQKNVDDRLNKLEKLWENHAGKVAGIAFACGVFGGLISLFFSCHMGFCK